MFHFASSCQSRLDLLRRWLFEIVPTPRTQDRPSTPFPNFHLTVAQLAARKVRGRGVGKLFDIPSLYQGDVPLILFVASPPVLPQPPPGAASLTACLR